MRLRLPNTLHYPITVTALLKQTGEVVERSTPLFNYSYAGTATGTHEDGTSYDYSHTYTTRFESSVEGTLVSWQLNKGAVIEGPRDVAEIDEPCTHSVQFGGMCVNCGKDMTQLSYAATTRDASRASINMVHDNTALVVSQDEATKIETEAKRRLIGARKLSLVVDLDQTIIHATVDPTVAEWQRDPDNPNHDAVKDVRAFQLVDDGPGGRGTWYYIKLRPGLKQFLENVSKAYELHIYTMGTRAYAQNIANLIDPDRRIFGDRILSRDESGSMVAKNLQRLFPVDTKMVVIIDDRGDVWNWSPNLIKVTQFSFFIGIGDINSSFLPKRPRAPPVSKDGAKKKSAVAALLEDGSEVPESAAVAELASNGEISNDEATSTSALENDVSALEQLVSMGGGDDPNVLQEQTAKQDEVLTAQLEKRPLLQKQKELEAEEESDSDSERPRHHLLNDDDNELYFLERSLKKVHAEFFENYSRKVADVSGGRIAELRGSLSGGSRKPKSSSQDLDLEVIPDIKAILPSLKKRVLAGVTIVFSGVVPLGTYPHTAEIVVWAHSFGARISEVVSRRHTTHVVAARNRTAKVRQAVQRGKGAIKVVSVHWLMDCIVRWEKVDEQPYLLSTDEADLGKPFPDEQDEEEEILSASESQASGADDTDPELVKEVESELGTAGRRRLSLRTSNLTGDTDDEEFEKLKPTTAMAGLSPVGGTDVDWNAMHEEMKEFLGSSDDSDDEDDDDDLDPDLLNKKPNTEESDADVEADAGARPKSNGPLEIYKPNPSESHDDLEEKEESFDLDSRPPPPAAVTSAPRTNGSSGSSASDLYHLHPSSAAISSKVQQKRNHTDMTGSDGDASGAESSIVGQTGAGAGGTPRKKMRASGLRRSNSSADIGADPDAGASVVDGADNDDAEDSGWDEQDQAELEAELMADDDDDDG